MQKLFWDAYGSFYFIGIGGVSMSALAKFMLAEGKKVGGSDNTASIYTSELKELGAKIEIADEKKSVKNYDVIVYTDAVRENDVQLEEARALNKPVMPRGQLLYEVGRAFGKVIAVSGCHGKTTCTSMLAHIFSAADKNFCAHIGGRDKTFSNFYFCGKDYFITEACEYKKNFLLLKPHVGVILSSDPDHLECYGSAENLKRAYVAFARSSEIQVTLYGDMDIGVTFGFNKNAHYHAKNVICKDGFYSFTAYDGVYRLGEIDLKVYGKHNVLNALAAIAAARSSGIIFEKIKQGLESFSGVERRFEYLGNFNGASCIADYAHHPDEIKATLAAVKKIVRGKLYVVFQPHTYSRTKNLFKSFVKCLSLVNNLLIYRTFAAREYFDDEGSALTLSQSVKKSLYGDCPADILEFSQKAGEGDIILFLGAGDVYDIAKNILSDYKSV